MYKYISIGIDSFNKDLWEKPENCIFVKPIGGLWASKYTPDSEYLSSWHRFCVYSEFSRGNTNKAIMFNLKDNARICTIDSLNDLRSLMIKYRNNDVPLPFLNYLDFEKISEKFDVIELTERGEIETKNSYPENLYGWDAECILILNYDVIGEQETRKIS